MSKDTITIGVDSSTTNCGVAIYENGNLLKTQNLVFKGTYDLDKLEDITKSFDKLFKKHKPKIVILERPAPVRNSKTLTSLNQVAGAIWAAAILNGAFVDHIHNKIIKRLTETKTKQDAIDKVEELFDLKVETDHEADAVLAVRAYRLHLEEKTKVR